MAALVPVLFVLMCINHLHAASVLETMQDAEIKNKILAFSKMVREEVDEVKETFASLQEEHTKLNK